MQTKEIEQIGQAYYYNGKQVSNFTMELVDKPREVQHGKKAKFVCRIKFNTSDETHDMPTDTTYSTRKFRAFLLSHGARHWTGTPTAMDALTRKLCQDFDQRAVKELAAST